MQQTESWAARSTSRLIVLLSSERSGSTLLRVMLGAHSRILAPQELFLLRYPDFETWRARKPVAMESLVELFTLLGRPMDAAAISVGCAGRSTPGVYEWVFDFVPRGLFVLDKTPAYANDATTLTRSAALSPFYIWLIRHPLGVIDSHVRLKMKERHRRPLPKRVLRPLRDAVEEWTDGMSALARTREAKWILQNSNVRNFLRDVPASQQAVLHFEQLVRAPEGVVQKLCAAIGIEPEAGMVKPKTRQVMNPKLGDPNFHLHGKIDAQPAESWAERYTEAQLRPEARELIEQLGITKARALDPHAA
jgi:LPS sulfotransferase NodH